MKVLRPLFIIAGHPVVSTAHTSPADGFPLGYNVQQSCAAFVKGPMTCFVSTYGYIIIIYIQLATTILLSFLLKHVTV